jgi:hypothetical protein
VAGASEIANSPSLVTAQKRGKEHHAFFLRPAARPVGEKRPESVGGFAAARTSTSPLANFFVLRQTVCCRSNFQQMPSFCDLEPLSVSRGGRWGENAQYFIIAADDDQTIYSWCGATPDAVLDPEIPEDHKIILKESHRVPRHVHARANRLIHQVTRRQEKVYDPRPEDGMCVDISRGGYKSPEYWILKTIMQHLENGQKVMLLASCSYMLHPVIAVLRQFTGVH